MRSGLVFKVFFCLPDFTNSKLTMEERHHHHIALEMDNKISSHNASNTVDKANYEANILMVNDINNLDNRAVSTSQRKLRSVSELDDDDGDERPLATGPTSGVDDGLLSVNENNGGHTNKPQKPENTPNRPNYGFPGYDGPGYVDIKGVRTPIPDINAYQHKKTLAQGMMDLALLSANANQLRYVLESYERHPYYYPSIVFISLSIFFQIAVGVGLILNSKYNIRNEKDICRANKVNNYTVIGIFIVTVVNVFISAFGVADVTP